jgi:hypothetical protein
MRLRLYHALLLIPLLTGPVLAQTAAEHHGRRTADQHFADANATHDGHLTLDQATAGYKSLVKPFTQIDVNHHGYITMDDVNAWKAAKKAARQAAKLAATHAAEDAADGIVRPRPAVDHGGRQKAIDTSTDMIAPRTGVDLPATPLNGTYPS